MSCCRRSAFSAISSVRKRVRSAMKPPATLEGRHSLRSALTARATVAASRKPGTRSTARSERIRRRSSSLVPQRILSDRAAEEERSQDRQTCELPTTDPNVFDRQNPQDAAHPLNDTLASSTLRRVLAQVEVTYSNSIIEARWRSLKHQWLYLHTLDERIPHGAFEGQTPDEMYFGRGAHVPDDLAVRRREARQQRVARNRKVACAACPGFATAERRRRRMKRTPDSPENCRERSCTASPPRGSTL